MTDDNLGAEIDNILSEAEANNDKPKEVKPMAEAKAEKTASKTEDRVTIMIQEGDEEDNATFVSHNGYAYQIKRGVPVSVPRKVLNILNDAKVARLVKVGLDENGHEKRELREFQRFPYSVLG